MQLDNAADTRWATGNGSDVPKDEQVLLHPETLGAEVPPGAFAEATGATGPLLRVAFQLGELHQLVVLEGVVVTGLFPHSGRVDHQRLLWHREERCQGEELQNKGCDRMQQVRRDSR